MGDQLTTAMFPVRPFSNGTEGSAWMAAWCEVCAADHGMHSGDGPYCSLISNAMFGDGSKPPGGEAWLGEPDDGRFFLPSRMVCLAFKPCERCGGDPGADERAQRIAEVTAYWRERAR